MGSDRSVGMQWPAVDRASDRRPARDEADQLGVAAKALKDDERDQLHALWSCGADAKRCERELPKASPAAVRNEVALLDERIAGLSESAANAARICIGVQARRLARTRDLYEYQRVSIDPKIAKPDAHNAAADQYAAYADTLHQRLQSDERLILEACKVRDAAESIGGGSTVPAVVHLHIADEPGDPPTSRPGEDRD